MSFLFGYLTTEAFRFFFSNCWGETITFTQVSNLATLVTEAKVVINSVFDIFVFISSSAPRPFLVSETLLFGLCLLVPPSTFLWGHFRLLLDFI